MKNAVILHGKPGRSEYFSADHPSPSNHHWLRWLQKQMLEADYLAQTPEMPKAWEPDYEAWREVFEYFPVKKETILIGHSCGGGFLLRWLSENQRVTPYRVLLVAPWLDPDKSIAPFFDFTIDPALTTRTDLHVLHSHDDMPTIIRSIPMIQSVLPDAHYHWFEKHGHFCFDDMKTDVFPELRELALS